MLKKSFVVTAGFTSVAILTLSAFAAVTLDKNQTDERTDRRTVTDTVVKMDKTLDNLLLEQQRTNELLEELVKKGGSVVPPRKIPAAK
jgi:hypothetical protein